VVPATVPAVTSRIQLGVVGAGQLGRMLHQAAIGLGVEILFMADGQSDPAAQVSPNVQIGSAMSAEDLATMATSCDVVSFEHEVVNLEAIARLAEGGAVFRPGSHALGVVADKIGMRTAVEAAGLPVPPWRVIETTAAAVAAMAEWSEVVLKVSRGGYDGRGVFVAEEPDHAVTLASELLSGGARLLAEPRLAFDAELAVVVARRPGGDAVVYDPVTTVQIDGQCRQVSAPATVPASTAADAVEMARSVAEAIDAVGLVAVELFFVGGRLLINELAVRPHNTGHHTIDAAVTSQFENHIRAVLDLPLGAATLRTPATMVNVVGNAAGDDPRDTLAAAAAADPGAHIHLYGKSPRPDRKIGHVTVCDDDPARASVRAWRVVAALRGDVPARIEETLV